MFFKRFYNDHLAQASYLVGCQATGEAIVVDPLLDPALYLDAAAAEGLRIVQVTETHIHADFVSGARALAAAAGARLLLSAEGGTGWEYAFAAKDGATLLRNGDRVMVGNVALDVVHTPGHTPEHLSFVVTDTPAASGPMGVLTGDFVFVGDVGRPDLLERAAGHVGTMDAAARALFRSLHWFRALPDHLQIWPGHGAGSACGKALGAVPTSTVGYERVANWALQAEREDAFVREVLAGQPTPPPYFAEMKRINRDEPPTAVQSHVPERAPDDALGGDAHARVVLDLRPTAAFASGHLRGALNAPLGRSFVRWIGALLDPRSPAPIVLVTAEETAARQAAYTLSLVGRTTAGWCDASATLAWATERSLVDTVPQIDASDLAGRLARGEVTVVDVRNQDEWDAGHLPGAIHVPLASLAGAVATLPNDKPLVLQCQGGGRSSVAASLLRAAGRDDATNLTGGFGEWAKRGLPVARD